MKILFFGTPLFAEIVLQELLKSKHKVVGVVARADKPSGRGNKMTSPKIVELAKENKIEVFQFEKLNEHLDEFRKIDCDIFVTASYGKILSKSLLEICPCINVHPSLLPKYRGATPIQNALLCGDKVTGVSIMKTEVGMDDGDIFVSKKVEILPEDDYNTLLPRLARIGAELLIGVLDKIQEVGFDNVKRKKQNNADATFVKPISKEEGLLDFSQSAESLVNKVKAFVDSPVAYFFLGDERIKVFKASVFEEDKNCQNFTENLQKNMEKCKKNDNFGEILQTKKRFLIQTGCGIFEVLKCQAAGGKVLDSASFLNGYHFKTTKANENILLHSNEVNQ